MHPEIVSSTPGTCPKCGMALVLKNETPIKVFKPENDAGLGKLTWKSYVPLIVIISLILITTLLLGYRDLQLHIFSLGKTLSYFMTGFFLVFGGFKLMDLQGFAHGYASYDLLAKKVPVYGYIYPFIELFFAFCDDLYSFLQNSLNRRVFCDGI